MFWLESLTALGLDKRKKEGGRERECVHTDILPAGLVIDEPQPR